MKKNNSFLTYAQSHADGDSDNNLISSATAYTSFAHHSKAICDKRSVVCPSENASCSRFQREIRTLVRLDMCLRNAKSMSIDTTYMCNLFLVELLSSIKRSTFAMRMYHLLEKA